MSECWTPCPQCDAEIEFYTVVDEMDQCSECGTGRNTLFSIAQTDTTSEQAVAADGGVDDG
jgi:hypothetical protein